MAIQFEPRDATNHRMERSAGDVVDVQPPVVPRFDGASDQPSHASELQNFRQRVHRMRIPICPRVRRRDKNMSILAIAQWQCGSYGCGACSPAQDWIRNAGFCSRRRQATLSPGWVGSAAQQVAARLLVERAAP